MVKRVYVIDDDKMVLFIQDKMLRASNFCEDVLKFYDVQEALENLKKETLDEVILFLDINMPYMSGWEALNELKKINSKTQFKVVMVTSSIDLEDKEEAKNYSQVIDFLIKPVNVDRLNELKSNPSIKHLF